VPSLCLAVGVDGGDIFRLSKILGHSNVMITQKVYAHLAPEAWEQDYHWVGFNVPDTGTVYAMTKRPRGAHRAPPAEP